MDPVSNQMSADRHFLASCKVNKWHLCFDLPHSSQDGTAHHIFSTQAIPLSQVLFTLQISGQMETQQRSFTELPSPHRLFFQWPSHWIVKHLGFEGGSSLAVFPQFSTPLFFLILPKLEALGSSAYTQWVEENWDISSQYGSLYCLYLGRLPWNMG